MLLGSGVDQDEATSVGQDAVRVCSRELFASRAIADTLQRVERGEKDIVAFEAFLCGGQAFLTVLLVEQAHRRAGIGARLVRDAFANAGAHRMDLMSCADGFYEALGFQRMSGFRITAGGEFRQTFR